MRKYKEMLKKYIIFETFSLTFRYNDVLFKQILTVLPDNNQPAKGLHGYI
jgi:hypothetical protein